MNLTTILKQSLFWLPLTLIAVANGAFRQAIILRYVDDFEAHQISTFTFLALLVGYCLIIKNKIRIISRKEALVCGVVWFVLTIVFESILGLFVSEMSVKEVIEEYNLFEGKLWPLIVISTFLLPYILFAPRHVHDLEKQTQ